jgi:hypothetical protein
MVHTFQKDKLVSIVKNLGLALCSILFVLFICEVALRLGGWKVVTFYPIAGFHQFDADLGWIQMPNHEAFFRGRGFNIRVRTNSLGFRDKEYQFSRQAGIKRVIVLGDSFTWGWGVEQEETFCGVAAREMKNTEFINLGQAGYGTVQEYLLFKKLGIKFSPDFTVLAFFVNDVYDNYDAGSLKKPLFRLEGGNLVLKRRPKPFKSAINHFLQKNFLLYNFIDYRFAMLKQLTKRFNVIDVPEDYFYKNYLEKTSAAWDLTDAFLIKLNEETRHRLLIMYIPDRLQIEKETYHKMLTALNLEEKKIDVLHPNKILKRFSEDHGIPFLDLTPFFRKANEKGVPIYFKRDGHLTKEGNELVGQQLREKIEKLLQI